jgi:hypothetical protein
MTIRDITSFRRELEKIDRVLDRKADFPQQVFRLPAAGIRFIELDDLWAEEVFEVLQRLAAAVDSQCVLFIVLKPDPIDYYYAQFGKLPLVELDVAKSSGSAYINALHEDPGDSPADAIVHNSDVMVIFPENMRWMIYGDRNFEIGIIAGMDTDAVRAVDAIYPCGRLYSARYVIDHILPAVFRGAVPSDLSAQLLQNYGDNPGS